MTLRDDLIKAKALIDTPEKWLQGALKRNGCFCAMGAGLETRNDEVLFALQHHLPNPAWDTIPGFNDAPTTTHADIMALFDRAIAAAGVSP